MGWTRSRRVAVVRRVAVGVAATALLAACRSSPSTDPANADGTASSKPSTDSTSTSTPPTDTQPAKKPTDARSYDPVPPSATAHTNDGAIAFAQFWSEQLVKNYKDPNPGAIARLCRPDAPTCVAAERDITDLHQRGWHATSPIASTERFTVVSSADPALTKIVFIYHTLPYVIVDASGVTQESHPAATYY